MEFQALAGIGNVWDGNLDRKVWGHSLNTSYLLCPPGIHNSDIVMVIISCFVLLFLLLVLLVSCSLLGNLWAFPWYRVQA